MEVFSTVVVTPLVVCVENLKRSTMCTVSFRFPEGGQTATFRNLTEKSDVVPTFGSTNQNCEVMMALNLDISLEQLE